MISESIRFTGTRHSKFERSLGRPSASAESPAFAPHSPLILSVDGPLLR